MGVISKLSLVGIWAKPAPTAPAAKLDVWMMP
jgi:hypothetical protein